MTQRLRDFEKYMLKYISFVKQVLILITLL